MQMVIRDQVGVVFLLGRFWMDGFANPNSTASQIQHLISDDLKCLAAFSQIKSVTAQMRKGAVLNNAIPGKLRPQIASNADRSLSVRITIRVERPIGMAENHVAEGNVLNRSIRFAA